MFNDSSVSTGGKLLLEEAFHQANGNWIGKWYKWPVWVSALHLLNSNFPFLSRSSSLAPSPHLVCRHPLPRLHLMRSPCLSSEAIQTAFEQSSGPERIVCSSRRRKKIVVTKRLGDSLSNNYHQTFYKRKKLTKIKYKINMFYDTRKLMWLWIIIKTKFDRRHWTEMLEKCTTSAQLLNSLQVTAQEGDSDAA